MKVAMGADHGGYALKESVKKYLTEEGYEIEDLGCDAPERCDYPVFGKAVAQAVAQGKAERGIVICTTGIGISIAANKVEGIRCALCTDTFMAKMCRLHNDANVLSMGAGITGDLEAKEIAKVFLETEFSNGERHVKRVAML